MIQETVAHVHHLTQELESLREQCAALREHQQQQQLIETKPILDEQESQTDGKMRNGLGRSLTFSVYLDDGIEEKLILLQNQYMELDQTNRSWESFYDNQLEILKNEFRAYLPSDEDLTFEQVIQAIGAHLVEQQEHGNDHQLLDLTKDELELLKQQLAESQNNEQLLHQKIGKLHEESHTLEQQLEEQRFSIDSLKNTLELMSNENEVLKQEHSEYHEKNESLADENFNLTQRVNELEASSLSSAPQHETLSSSLVEPSQHNAPRQAHGGHFDDVPIHTIAPLRSASSLNFPSEGEETQRLREDLARLAEQHAQLEEANRAWNLYHQSQLEIFRQQLKDWIPFDEHTSLEQIAQNIVTQLDQLASSQERGEQIGKCQVLNTQSLSSSQV